MLSLLFHKWELRVKKVTYPWQGDSTVIGSIVSRALFLMESPPFIPPHTRSRDLWCAPQKISCESFNLQNLKMRLDLEPASTNVVKVKCSHLCGSNAMWLWSLRQRDRAEVLIYVCPEKRQHSRSQRESLRG